MALGEGSIKFMLRIGIRYTLLSIAILCFGLSALVFLLSVKQISKNRMQLADMQDRVAAIKKFQNERSRPPTDDEFQAISSGLPVRYLTTKYGFAAEPKDCAIKLPGWPPTGGWAIWYWRGEWHEYYSSWNDHYTLAKGATWWGFCGYLLFLPALGALFLVLSFSPIFRKKRPPDRAKRPGALKFT